MNNPTQAPSKELATAVTALALLGCSFAATWQHSPMLALVFFVASAIAVKVGKL